MARLKMLSGITAVTSGTYFEASLSKYLLSNNSAVTVPSCKLSTLLLKDMVFFSRQYIGQKE
jgi:hypothetical protein